MANLLRRNVCLISVFLFVLTLLGCDQTLQGTEEPKTAPIDKSAFTYQALNLPAELSSADHVYHCYEDQTHALLSVCSRNGALFGPLQKTDYLALCDTEGGMVSYPLETDAYIISAVPYNGGVLYVDHVNQDGGGVAWSLVLKDSTKETVLDTGTVSDYEQTPALFYVQDVPYYLCMNEDGFSIKKVVEQGVVVVYSETDCDLARVIVHSNGKQYCFMVKYPQEDFCRFYICDASGVKYRHKLGGKITSFTITDQYAICGTGDEITKKHSVEAVDITTGNVKIFAQTYGALYGLRGVGGLAVCNDGKWQPLAVDIENETVFAISAPRSPQGGDPLFFYPLGEKRFFVINKNDDAYRFYLLSIAT